MCLARAYNGSCGGLKQHSASVACQLQLQCITPSSSSSELHAQCICELGWGNTGQQGRHCVWVGSGGVAEGQGCSPDESPPSEAASDLHLLPGPFLQASNSCSCDSMQLQEHHSSPVHVCVCIRLSGGVQGDQLLQEGCCAVSARHVSPLLQRSTTVPQHSTAGVLDQHHAQVGAN
jgi:hypothetical protein